MGFIDDPQISFIGKTEEQLTDEDVPYEVASPITAELRVDKSRATRWPVEAPFPSDTLELLACTFS